MNMMNKTILRFTIPVWIIIDSTIWQSAHSQSAFITLTGSWSLSIDQSNLQGGAGSDFVSTYESATNQVTISINKIVYGNFFDWFISYNWRVAVRKSDINWLDPVRSPSVHFHIEAQRTGNGTGFGSISGGTSYQEITDSDLLFFSGSMRRLNIPVQYRLSDVSVLMPVNSYSTNILYTLTEY
jgi:hypothetical protein